MDLRSKHGLSLMDRLWRMKEAGEMTDVVLVTEGVRFPCHRVVLSAFSPYFMAMFTCGLQECNRREVTLQDTPPEILRLILNYMYRSELPLSNANVQGVAVAAFVLQLDDVFVRCQRHMTENMDASNCLGVYHFARDLGAEDLRDLAHRYLRQNFAQVCLHEEVVELECHKLLTLIGSDDLNVSREESILDVVLRWVNSDPDRRAASLPELLRKVRLPLVSPDFLREALRRNTVLLANAECQDMVQEALELIQCPPLATPRKLKLRYGMETVDLLLCIGAEGQGIRSRHGSYSDYSFCFSPTTGQIHYITSPRYGEALGYVCAGVVTHDNDIVVAGEAGARRMAREKSRNVDVYRYKASAQGSWQKLCSAEHRDMYALGAVGDTLYLLGGQMKLRKQYFITNSVERWSMRGGAWRSTTPLPLPLAYHCAVTLKDRLYVLGGRTPQFDRPDDEPECLSSRLFRLDPGASTWVECGPMRYSKYRCSAVALNGEIYVLGGIGCEGVDRGQSRRCLDVVEIYNPDGDFWRAGPPLPGPLLSLHTNASNAGVVGGKIYVCGFYRGAGRHDIITKDILELDPWENRWTMVARRVLMHDSYDVCLVANLNPRGLKAPPPDLLEE
ncbi:kelch repeat and BTB domain-containing protein 12 [Anguilla anguilla]|uniref:BTB domain-containing protein n=1 Tax=Anguilla anguilla TaxID=7936 RepID=A0A9D3M080_ANGAN|nr:kelch repeat and BTB domain-containing protein 12 [Anguilla anguilla]KAG5835943.1 hypothetical protein ANANG_G00249380 [Anguilla anguilla]